jgi:hypothetical protein
MLEKPAYGSPCNACGKCCQDELCALAKKIFGPRLGPCPALAEMSGGFGCGLILSPHLFAPIPTSIFGEDAMAKAAALLCAAGAGCDAQGFGEVVDEAVRKKVLDATRLLPEDALARAREKWSNAIIV